MQLTAPAAPHAAPDAARLARPAPLTIHTACQLAKSLATFAHAAAVQLLISAGLTINQAARFVFGCLRAMRGAA